MNSSIITSTFCLTLLLMVGLFFFIRASVKDRIEELTIISELSEETVLSQLQDYFYQRAYKIKAVDANSNQVTFEGFVRPSWFLAILLTILALFGLLSLALVISLLYPALGVLSLLLGLLAPIAGIFYWKNAGRQEQVKLKIQPLNNSQDKPEIKIQVTGHRDELSQLEKFISISYEL